MIKKRFNRKLTCLLFQVTMTSKRKEHKLNQDQEVKKESLNKKLKPIHPFFEPKTNNDKLTWTYQGVNQTVLIGITPEFNPHHYHKALLCDLDGTLIKPKGNHVFSKDERDWQWNLKMIPSFLQNLLQQDKVGLVIMTNQNGLSQWKKDGDKRRKEFQLKLNFIYNEVPISI